MDGKSGISQSITIEKLTNSDIAELLAVAGETAKGTLRKALRRASRKSFLWPEQATDVVRDGRSLEELPGIGPSLSRIITRWIQNVPEISEPPETRRDFLSWIDAQEILKQRPSWTKAVKGDLQMHTVWSDGMDSIDDMAQGALARGYEYIAITDHAKGLKIAGGIDEMELLQQAEEIREINAKLTSEGKSLRILHSIELNLNPSGAGDMDPDALEKLDLVLGCFHSSLRKKEDQTERYLAALRNPSLNILGHPRGRIYNFRLGLTANWQRVFDTAAELDKAVEIDSYPDRQDLNVDLLKLAAKAGCRISIGTDAHGAPQLRFVDFGLAAALTAGIRRDRILNFLTPEELLNWRNGLRDRH